MSPLRCGPAHGAATSGGGVTEHLLRIVAPAVLVCFETEAPTRITSTATTGVEWDRLRGWMLQTPEREEALRLALLDRDLRGGVARGVAWRAELLGEGGGVVAGIEKLLAERSP